MDSTPETNALLSVNELAKLFGCTRRYLDYLRTTNDGPEFVQIGRQIRYRRTAVDAWLDANTTKPRA